MEEFIIPLVLAMGIPTGFTGLMFWLIQRKIDSNEKARNEKEQNTERFMLLIMQNTRATNVLAEATARAVQRIPDARCNGDMTAALAQAAKIQKEEKDFLFDQGIKHIFDNK